MHGSKTGMMYILDRTNGTPLIGIDERPVPQQAEQKTARTQPFPIGDAFVPLCPEGLPARTIRVAACSRRSGQTDRDLPLAPMAAWRGRR